MNRHPTLDELSRWRRGAVAADRVLVIAEHLATCSECGAASTEQFDLDRPARRLYDELASPPPRQQRSRWWMYAVAAALVIAIIGPLVLSRKPQPDRPQAAGTTGDLPGAQPSSAAADDPATPEWDAIVDGSKVPEVKMPAILRSLRQAPDVLRGVAPAAPLTPTGVVVKSARPELRWPARRGARSTVILFESDVEVMRSEPLTTRTWTPPRPLKRNVTYTWQVNIETNDDLEILPSPPAPAARFHVLGSSALAELDAAEYHHPDDHLLLGALHARAGLEAEAREHLQRVTPRDAEAARRILRTMESWSR